MATPDFIGRIRATIGHELLWLPGVSVVVLDDAGRVLLQRRVDDDRWALISGIPDPGEQPAAAVVREVLEETGVECAVESLVSVQSEQVMAYANGDICQFMNICFRARALRGEARVNDDESVAVGWFAPDALPDDLTAGHGFRIEQALAGGPTWFEPAGAG
ncbi:MAG: NUDIX domain-containing protein [Nocardia sp.]|nr:NUDIX domain-containing protein [Nocardia sp.]NUS94141.1 NUDIX domain-containing protein [Nocardia sp.]